MNTGYRSEFHNLYRLLGLCTSFSKKPFELFFSAGVEDQRLFEILIKSYSQSRYNNQFQVEEPDAMLLYERVSVFLILTKDLCADQIGKLETDANAIPTYTNNK